MFKNQTPEKAAMFALYEELYDAATEINKDAIHKAMLTLMEHFNLEDFMAELDSDMINVVHENRIHEIQDELHDICDSLQKTLDSI